MKKIITLFVFASLAVSFCGCDMSRKTVANFSSESTGSNLRRSETDSSRNSSLGVASSNDYEEYVSLSAEKALDLVVTGSMTEVEKAEIAYEWLFYHFKYRAATVDLSNGYTDELTNELAAYFFKYHKGSCEHYAAVQKVLFEKLGFNTRYVEGQRYASDEKAWGEHVWVMIEINGNWYHADGLFGGNHTKSLKSMFCVPDSAIEPTHKWDRMKYPACIMPQITK